MKKDNLDTIRTIWTGNDYYHMAEKYIDAQWENLIWPKIKDFDFTSVIDLAAGEGRNSSKLVDLAYELIIVDLCESNIRKCKERFKDKDNIIYKICNGDDIPIESNSVSLVYCFDAMVHFEPETVYNYLNEISRVLMDGGKAFIHHSNYSGDCCIDFRYNPHARNFMTQNLFTLWALRAGLKIHSSEIIDWGENEYFVKNLDCITILEK